MSEIYEVNENYEVEGTTNDTVEGGSNKGLLALAAGGALLVGGLAAAGIKKLKSKKDDKPKKQKTKYKIVKVPVEADEEIVEEEIETVEDVKEEPKKGKKNK